MKSVYVYMVKYWLPIAIAGTICLFALYAAVQQSMRNGANDPQVQLAQDGAALLSASTTPLALVGTNRIDMNKSLAPFIIVYDDAGKVLASSGYLNGQVPILPAGVFEYARNATDRITWQPASSTRIAAIVKHFDNPSAGQNKVGGFIVAGRNLREVEAREHQLLLMIGAAWVGLLLLTFITHLYSWAMERKSQTVDF